MPCTLLLAPLLLLMYPFWWLTWSLLAPLIVSSLLPPVPSRSFLQAWPFKHIGAYFNYSEIKELGDPELRALIAKRSVLFCVQPHGVFSFGGACAGVEWARRWWHPGSIPTAAAASVMVTPIVKHVVGLFGVCDAAAKPLGRRLARGASAVLYIGGIAELFLTSAAEERLFARKRKGFIKLALRAGSEVVPVYLFGNTSVLSVYSSAFLRRLARSTGITLTWFWGWRGTPVPRPRKIVGVLGRPLGMPSHSIADPTQAQVDEWHERYLAEVRRLFDTYKVFNEDYRRKELLFE